MKIWYMSAYDQPDGQSTRTYDYARQLVARGHGVMMFTNSYCHFTRTFRIAPNGAFSIGEAGGVQVVWLHSRPFRGNGLGRGLNMVDNARIALRAARSIRDRPDIIIAPSVPALTAWAAARIAKRLRVPFVYEVRDVWPAQLVDIGAISKYSATYVVFRLLEKRFYKQAAQIVSTLPFLTEHLIDSGGDPERLTVLPNGVDLEAFDNLPVYRGGQDDCLTVMYVGGFGVDHDVEVIVRTAHLLQDWGIRSFDFQIYGDGVDKERCVALARGLDVEKLTFHDPVPKTLVPQLQTHADIFIASIRDTPGFRFGINLNKIVAYLASGRPVVLAGNPPNNPVSDAQAGPTVPPSDPLALAQALLSLQRLGPEGREHLGLAASRYARCHYDIRGLGERMDSMLTAVYQESLGTET